MKETKVICFDFDDTLVPETDYIKSGFHVVANFIYQRTKVFSVGDIFDKLFQLYVESSENVFNRFCDLYLSIENQIDIKCLVDIYKKHQPNIIFSDDVKEVLFFLRVNGYKLAIISDGDFIQQNNKIQSTKATEFFDIIILTDCLSENRKAWKPSIIPFEKLKNDFCVEYNEIVYIGDNPQKDFYIKKYFPIKTIRLINDGIYHNSIYKENIREDLTILNLKELIDIFGEGR